MSLLRFKMVEAAIDHKAVEVKAPEGSPSEYFGTKVFGREAMRRYLNKTVYAQLLDTMQRGTPLTLEVADGVAAGGRSTTAPTTIRIGFSLSRAVRPRSTTPLPSRTAAGVYSTNFPEGACPAGARCVVVSERRYP